MFRAQIWEYFIGLQDELELVWPSPWNLGKTLFFVSRYLSWPEVVVLFACTCARLCPRSHDVFSPQRRSYT